MEQAHRFRVVAWWASGRTVIAQSSSAPKAIHFSSPPAFGGLEGRWTPEDLLLGALASWYTTKFQTLAEYSKFKYTDLQVEVEGVIRKAEKGYSLGEVVIRSDMTIPQEVGKNGPSSSYIRPKIFAWCLARWRPSRHSSLW